MCSGGSKFICRLNNIAVAHYVLLIIEALCLLLLKSYTILSFIAPTVYIAFHTELHTLSVLRCDIGSIYPSLCRQRVNLCLSVCLLVCLPCII